MIGGLRSRGTVGPRVLTEARVNGWDRPHPYAEANSATLEAGSEESRSRSGTANELSRSRPYDDCC